MKNVKENIKEKKNPDKDFKEAEKNLNKQIFGKPIETSRHPADGKIAKATNFKDYGQD